MTTATIPGKGRFARGIHPGDRKSMSAGAAIEVLPTPKTVLIALHQHTGAPNQPTLKPKSPVKIGDLVGDVGAFVAAPVHASVDGVTGLPTVTTLPNGRHVQAVQIVADAQQSLAGAALLEDAFGGDWACDPDGHAPEAIVEASRKAGLVGLGGAAFPTHVKLKANPAKPVDSLVVNGCECEPYLTADHRLMLEFPAPIVAGALLAARACGARAIYIAIEDNKPDAVEALTRAAAGTGIVVAAVKTEYPMGGERQLVPALMGREVPTGGLPLDVGVVVVNVGTAAVLARAVLRGKPLTHRVISVTGEGVARPANVLAPIGASYADLIDFCGGLKSDAARVVAGGPMMGFALGDLAVPVTKGTSGVVVLTERQVRRASESACIRCGRCVDVCSLNLVPTKIALASRDANWELARRYYIAACCECGSCAYTCPARIPLVQYIRQGKVLLPKEAK